MRQTMHIKLCTLDGTILSDAAAMRPEFSGFSSSPTRPPNLYTTFVSEAGTLPNPQASDTIGRLLGVRVQATDGKKYPALSRTEKHVRRSEAKLKKAYHENAKRTASVIHALNCLASVGDPSSIAIHIKNHPQVGEALDLALDWLNRFAKEWHGREQSRC